MPIEIKEFIINATINEAPLGNEPIEKTQADTSQDIIRECVEQVLRILRENQER